MRTILYIQIIIYLQFIPIYSGNNEKEVNIAEGHSSLIREKSPWNSNFNHNVQMNSDHPMKIYSGQVSQDSHTSPNVHFRHLTNPEDEWWQRAFADVNGHQYDPNQHFQQAHKEMKQKQQSKSKKRPSEPIKVTSRDGTVTVNNQNYGINDGIGTGKDYELHKQLQQHQELQKQQYLNDLRAQKQREIEEYSRKQKQLEKELEELIQMPSQNENHSESRNPQNQPIPIQEVGSAQMPIDLSENESPSELHQLQHSYSHSIGSQSQSSQYSSDKEDHPIPIQEVDSSQMPLDLSGKSLSQSDQLHSSSHFTGSRSSHYPSDKEEQQNLPIFEQKGKGIQKLANNAQMQQHLLQGMPIPLNSFNQGSVEGQQNDIERMVTFFREHQQRRIQEMHQKYKESQQREMLQSEGDMQNLPPINKNQRKNVQRLQDYHNIKPNDWQQLTQEEIDATSTEEHIAELEKIKKPLGSIASKLIDVRIVNGRLNADLKELRKKIAILQKKNEAEKTEQDFENLKMLSKKEMIMERIQTGYQNEIKELKERQKYGE